MSLFDKSHLFCPECLEQSGRCNKYCRYCLEFRNKGIITETEQDKKFFLESWRKKKETKEVPLNPTIKDLLDVWDYRNKFSYIKYKKNNSVAYPYRIPFCMLPEAKRRAIIRNIIKKKKKEKMLKAK